MNAEPGTFHRHLEQLTKPHQIPYQTDAGTKVAEVPGLLAQLRDEIFGGTNVGGAAGNKTRLPLNAPAADLYQLIDRQIAEVWGAAFSRVPNADTPEELVIPWAALVGEHKMVTYSVPETVTHPDPVHGWPRDHVLWVPRDVRASDLLARWVRAIEELFNPPRVADITAACVSCGVREVHKVQDGQRVRQTALQFVRDRETGDSTSARCLACGITWMPSQFLYLAEAIAANEKRFDVEVVA